MATTALKRWKKVSNMASWQGGQSKEVGRDVAFVCILYKATI